MALVQNTAEGGTNGVAVTVGNSGGGSGTAFSEVVSGVTFSNAQTMHGSLSYAMAGDVGTYNVFRLDSAGGPQWSMRAYARMGGSPSAETNFIAVQTAAGGNICSLNMTTGRNLKIVPPSGPVATFTTALTLNTWYRVVFYGTIGAGTALVTAKLYAGDDTTPIETQSLSAATTGSTNPARIYYGKLTAAPSITGGYFFDDVAQDLALAAEIGTEALPVTHVGSSAWVAPASSATVTPNYPPSLQEGDLVEAIHVTKPDTTTVATPANWWFAFSQAVGGGTQGAGAGACIVHVFRRLVPSGGLTGSQAFTLTGGSSPVACMRAWRYDATGYAEPQWVPQMSTFYSRTTGSTTFGGTGAANIDLAAEDWMNYVSVSADDQSTTHTISALAAASATLGTVSQDPSGTIINAQGNDISAAAAIVQCTAGASSAAPSATVSGNTSETGGGVFWRVRATGILASTDHTVTPTDSAGSTDYVAHTHVDETVDSAGSTDTNLVALFESNVDVDDAGSTDTVVITRTLGVSATDLAGSTDYAAHDHDDAATDAAGTTDTALISSVHVLAATDTAGATDTTVVSLGLGVAATDSAGSTDTSTVVVAQNVALTPTDDAGSTDYAAHTHADATVDTAGSTDTTVVAAGRAVTATDTVGSTDTAALTGDRNVTATDDTGSVDGWDADLVVVLPYDSAGSSDSVTVALSSGQTVTATDTAGSTDTASVVHDWAPTPTVDSAGSTDSAIVSRGVGVTATDTAGASDTAGAAQGDVHTDTAGASDTAVVALARGVTATDSAGTTDAATLTRGISATDNAGSTDSTVYARTLTPVDDTGSHDDPAVQLLGAGFVIWTDTAGSTDADTRTAAYSRPATDSAGIADSAQVSSAAGLTVSAVDSAGSSDSATVAATRALTATDGAGSTDSPAQTRTVTAADPAGSADSAAVALAAAGGVTATDSAGSSDSVALAAAYARLGTDDAGISDAVLAAVTRVLTAVDPAGTSDSASAVVTESTDATDSAGSSDTAVVVLTREILLTPTDDAGSSDGWTRLAVYTLTLLDSAGVTDLATVIITGPPPTTLDYAHADGVLSTLTANGTLYTLTANGKLMP